MRYLVCSFAVCGFIALLGAIGMSLLLALCAQLPRVSDVSFAAACESANTLATGIWVFVILFLMGIPCAVFREFDRSLGSEDPTQLQFSIRFLLTLMLIVSVVLGLLRAFLG